MTRAAPYDLIVREHVITDDVDAEGVPIENSPNDTTVRGSLDILSDREREIGEALSVRAEAKSRMAPGTPVVVGREVILAAQATGYPEIPSELAGAWTVVAVTRQRTHLRVLLARPER